MPPAFIPASATHCLSQPSPSSRTRRQRPTQPDPALQARARCAAKLLTARKTLRKRLNGLEPDIFSAVPLAARDDTTLSTDPDHWRGVFSARNEITVKWLWLVAAVARKAHRTYLQAFPEMGAALSLADLAQEGVCGLISAVERWDPRRGYAFDAYAFYSVKHAILRAIENQSRPIRLPVHVLNKLSKMRKIRERIVLAGAGDDPCVDEIAKLASVERGEAELYLQRSKTLASIDAPLPRRGGDNGGSTTLREFLVDHSVDVARQVERACTREAVAELVQASNLEELERSVVLLKFGLSDGVGRVRTEVSRILDVRVEKVRRAELSALNKLRETVKGDLAAWAELIS